MLLPDIDDVELIEVVHVTDSNRYWNDQDLAGDVVAIWESDQARDVLALVAELPGSERYRCFFPVWGIRAHSLTGVLFEIAFCYQCHGAALSGPAVAPGHRGIHTFDPDSPPAQELLRRFRACAP